MKTPESDFDYWSLVEPYWWRINIYDGPAPFLEDFGSAPVPVKTLFAAHWCVSEVSNGGLHQFFTNSTGVLAPEAVLGFRALLMTRLAEVLETAMEFFGNPYPREQAVRIRALDLYAEGRGEWDPFDRINDRFYELIATERGGFNSAADAYAARNRPSLATRTRDEASAT